MRDPLRRTCLLLSLALSLTACQFLAAPESTQPELTADLAPSVTAPPTPAATSTWTPQPTAIGSPTHTPEPYTLILQEPDTGISFKIPLTLQFVGTTSATLSFELTSPHRGSLFLWDAEGPVAGRSFSTSETSFMFTFQDLQPGREYLAAVGLEGGGGGFSALRYQDLDWGEVHIRTLKDEQEPVRIAVLGDSGFGDQVTYQLIENIASYEPDFVIHSGDVVYNIQEDADAPTAFAKKFYLPFSPLLHRMPVYPVVGNHDVEDATLWEGLPFYYHAFPPLETAGSGSIDASERRDWYALSVGGYQILLLNSQSFFGAGGYEQQTQWLKERLADQSFAAVIPVFHVPPYSSGLHRSDGTPVQRNWSHLFKPGNVPLVISGHDHNYQRLFVAGVTYVVTGGGSSVLYGQDEYDPHSRVFARRTHFVLLELFSDRIEITAIALEGEILDRATIPINPR